ncbi:hypothetical protein [Acinetobacter johnsonii]|uniref:hypothetical protein n=1 Tax=Acinetobacter johnsonii TaxID=40214 RepID=UPI00216A1454|nr:hypothetical protein [Acinetobacter johnsonii]MCS3527088.1 hypothetical protein [Acinetobacter johnsonii]
MNREFELHVISQIYDFLVEREGFTSLNLDRQIKEFFREVHLGQEEDFTILESNKISGNFGEVSYINLLNVPHFNDKDKFLKWAYKALNR